MPLRFCLQPAISRKQLTTEKKFNSDELIKHQEFNQTEGLPIKKHRIIFLSPIQRRVSCVGPVRACWPLFKPSFDQSDTAGKGEKSITWSASLSSETLPFCLTCISRRLLTSGWTASVSLLTKLACEVHQLSATFRLPLLLASQPYLPPEPPGHESFVCCPALLCAKTPSGGRGRT